MIISIINILITTAVYILVIIYINIMNMMIIAGICTYTTINKATIE